MTITLLDGGMGQELLARTGATPTGLWSTQAMIDHPDAVRSIHDDYFAAGADIATTNTYAIHRDRLDPAGIGDRFGALHQQAVGLATAAKSAAGNGQVAGEPLTDALPLLKDFDVAALLINCSTPEAVSQGLPLIADANVAFGAYANGFSSISDSFKTAGATTDRLEKRRDLGPTEYADFADQWVEQGASIVGGCCEVGPAHIAEMATRLGKRKT